MNESTKRPETALCKNCVCWSEPTSECRAVGPTWVEDYPDAIWPKTKPDDWCAWFSDDWHEVMKISEQREGKRG